MNFHDLGNYKVLKDVLKEMVPTENMNMFDAEFHNFRTTSSSEPADLVASNKEFLKNFMHTLPRKISITDFENVETLSYDVLKSELDTQKPKHVTFEDADLVAPLPPLAKLVEKTILARNLVTTQMTTKHTILEKLRTMTKMIDELTNEINENL